MAVRGQCTHGERQRGAKPDHHQPAAQDLKQVNGRGNPFGADEKHRQHDEGCGGAGDLKRDARQHHINDLHISVVQQAEVGLDRHAAAVDRIAPNQHRRIASDGKRHDRNASTMVHASSRPQRGYPQRKNHRLAHQPQHAEVVAPKPRDHLAHQQGPDHPPLNGQRSHEAALRHGGLHQSVCSLTLDTTRLNTPHSTRPRASTVKVERMRRGSTAMSGRLGCTSRSR